MENPDCPCSRLMELESENARLREEVLRLLPVNDPTIPELPRLVIVTPEGEKDITETCQGDGL